MLGVSGRGRGGGGVRLRHCERSEANRLLCIRALDCFASLAMTASHPFSKSSPRKRATTPPSSWGAALFARRLEGSAASTARAADPSRLAAMRRAPQDDGEACKGALPGSFVARYQADDRCSRFVY